MKFLSKYADSSYALLRIVAGFLFSIHGMQKVLGLFTDEPTKDVFSQMWIGGVIELVGGALVCVGFQTRVAAFVCSGTMAVAYAQFHWKFAFDERFLPVHNGGELAALYAFVFLYIACRGAVKWCVRRD